MSIPNFLPNVPNVLNLLKSQKPNLLRNRNNAVDGNIPDIPDPDIPVISVSLKRNETSTDIPFNSESNYTITNSSSYINGRASSASSVYLVGGLIVDILTPDNNIVVLSALAGKGTVYENTQMINVIDPVRILTHDTSSDVEPYMRLGKVNALEVRNSLTYKENTNISLTSIFVPKQNLSRDKNFFNKLLENAIGNTVEISYNRPYNIEKTVFTPKISLTHTFPNNSKSLVELSNHNTENRDYKRLAQTIIGTDYTIKNDNASISFYYNRTLQNDYVINNTTSNNESTGGVKTQSSATTKNVKNKYGVNVAFNFEFKL